MNRIRFWKLLIGLAAIASTACTVVSLSLNCPPTAYCPIDEYAIEKPSAVTAVAVRSVEQAKAFLSSNYSLLDQVCIAQAIDDFLRKKFLHTYSEYSFRDNWLAHLSGFVWINLRNPVTPDDILKQDVGGCSQQGLVFQHLLREYGIEYTTVGFASPNHFAVAAKLEGVWYFFDSDLEPDNSQLVPLSDVLNGSALPNIYAPRFGEPFREAALAGRVWTMNENRYPAPRAFAFHRLTNFYSTYGWLMAWAIYFAVSFSRRENCPPVSSQLCSRKNSICS